MDLNSIPMRKKGEMPAAEEWNSLVQAVKNIAGKSKDTGNLYGHLPRTLFLNGTGQDIPPFSVFKAERISNKDSGNSQYAEFEATQISSETELPEFYGTNGKYPIPHGRKFWGYIIDTTHDFLAVVQNMLTRKKCSAGLIPHSFELDATKKGLFICGKAPFEENLYFVRKAPETGEYGILQEAIDHFSSQETYEVKTTRGNDETILLVSPSEIDKFSPGFAWNLPAGTPVKVEDGKIVETFLPELSGNVTIQGAVKNREYSVDLSNAEMFNGSRTLQAFPSPNIPQEIDFEGETPVVVRWNHAAGKWFFFVVRAGGGESGLVQRTLEGGLVEFTNHLTWPVNMLYHEEIEKTSVMASKITVPITRMTSGDNNYYYVKVPTLIRCLKTGGSSIITNVWMKYSGVDESLIFFDGMCMNFSVTFSSGEKKETFEISWTESKFSFHDTTFSVDSPSLREWWKAVNYLDKSSKYKTVCERKFHRNLFYIHGLYPIK